MEKISYKEFRNFLDSDVDEAEYFGCNKDNLITMREYLLSLKERFEICESELASDKQRIKDKYSRITKWQYDYQRDNLLFCIDKTLFYLKKDEKTGIYKANIAGGSDLALFYNLKKYYAKSLQIGKWFPNELENIKKYGEMYFDKDNNVESVSSIFSLTDVYYDSIINCNGSMFFRVYKDTLIPSESTNSAFEDFHYNTDNVSVEDKQKLLTKIMVPRGFLN